MDDFTELAEPEFGEDLPGLRATQRDLGLMRGMTALPLSASIVNSVVGVGIFTLPAEVSRQAGAAAPAAYLATSVLMAAITICFAEASSRVPTSGGAYGTVEAAFGPAAGFVVGLLFIVTDVLANGGIAAAIADLAASQAPLLAAPPVRAASILAIYLLLAATNLIGIARIARLLTFSAALKLAPLGFFLLLGLISLASPIPAGPAPPPVTTLGFGRALLLTLFAFQGMEIALGASGEVKDPSRTVPRALFLTMLFVLVLYLGAQLSAQHILGSALAYSKAPLADAAGQFGHAARMVILVGAALSMFSYLVSDVLGTSRMIFAMGRDGFLPRPLGKLRMASHVPANAVVTYLAIGFVVAVTGSFLELVALSALAMAAIYILNCLAAVVLRRQRVALAGVPLDFPGLTAAACIGLGGMLVMIAAASWAELAGLAAAVAAGLGVYRLRRRSL